MKRTHPIEPPSKSFRAAAWRTASYLPSGRQLTHGERKRRSKRLLHGWSFLLRVISFTSDRIRGRVWRIGRDSGRGSGRNSSPTIDAPSPAFGNHKRNLRGLP